MRALVLGLTAVAVLAAYGFSSAAQAGEPLMMRGAASVTPGDETPTAAVDSLSEEVSPTATANTTDTNIVDDAIGDDTPVETPVGNAIPAPAQRGDALPPAP